MDSKRWRKVAELFDDAFEGLNLARQLPGRSTIAVVLGLQEVVGGDELVEWGKKLWETKLDDGLTMVDRAIKTHVITSYHGLPRMRAALSGPGTR